MANLHSKKYEVISNLVRNVSSNYDGFTGPIINTMEKNFDTFFDNLELIAEEYISIKNIPMEEKWDFRPRLEQIASVYKGVEKVYMQDFVETLNSHYGSARNGVLDEADAPHINHFSEESAKKYVLSFEINEKYRRPKVYDLIFGSGTGRSEQDPHSIKI